MARSTAKKKYLRKFRVKRLFKECQFCQGKKNPDYKNIDQLGHYLYRTGKITSRKVNGNCANHQRKLTQAIKRARFLALLPFVQRIK